jgi:hypothetical protein
MATEGESKPVYRYRFNDVVMDEARFELRVSEQVVDVQLKTLEVFLVLFAPLAKWSAQTR